MNCLLDYIGIRGCGITAPASGMYINSLPGVELAGIEGLADADQSSFQGVWDDIQERAIERFRIDVIGRLSGFNSRYRLKQITQTVDLGSTVGDAIVPTKAAAGLVIELNNPNDQFVCSNMQTLYVQSIQFYAVDAGNFTIKVRDADLGTQLDSFLVAGTVGWNVTACDKFYDARRVSITVGVLGLNVVSLDLSQFNLSGFANNGYDSGYWGWNNGLWFDGGCTGSAQVRGYQSDANGGNPVYGQDTYGVSCVFSVRCTYNNVVCKNKRYFASAFRLCLGIELMTERMYTSRINKWTTVDAKKAQRLRAEFEAQYRGGELKDGDIVTSYEGELKKACDSIDLDLTDCCLEADATILWRETQL